MCNFKDEKPSIRGLFLFKIDYLFYPLAKGRI